MLTTDNFLDIVLHEKPLIDVRAPIEFTKGAFINAINLPIMNDEERHLVGICYKNNGNEEATKLGHQLVSGSKKEERILAWQDFISNHPDSLIYCFRGGSRSRISQQWIYEVTGMEISRLHGGYKAFRNYLIQALQPSSNKSIPLILGGYTGAGKTKIIEQLDNAIDLEGLANHRGSSFGKYSTPQPTQINFENNLAYALLQHKQKEHSYMVLEDEGKNIGRCYLPKPLVDHFNKGLLVLLDVPLETRIFNTIDEYVIQDQNLYKNHYGPENGLSNWYKSLSQSMDNIYKRLGLERYNRLKTAFNHAFEYQQKNNSSDLFYDWAKILLLEYYDPMYTYQINKTTKKLIFRGNFEEVLEYLLCKS